jgi:hypothetical protein
MLWGGKGLVFVDRCQKISVFLITFRRCRYSAELDMKWELIGGTLTAVSTSDPTVGELPQALNNSRSIAQKVLTTAIALEVVQRSLRGRPS